MRDADAETRPQRGYPGGFRRQGGGPAGPCAPEDCRAVVAQEAGNLPRRALERHGIPVILSSGAVRDALLEAYGR